MIVDRPLHSPLLSNCPPTLPAHYYYDSQQFEREQNLIWRRNWVYVGRSKDLAPMSVETRRVAGQNLILLKDRDGALSCFHNTCRHRGAELCARNTKLGAGLITCPYHQWSYDLQGRLVRIPYATPTTDFDKDAHALFPVALHQWNGLVFVCLADTPPPFDLVPDPSPQALDNWPIADLVVGHTAVKQVACNWKIFWENYNECLHCPGTHPSLCDMVPVYKRGIMAANEDVNWTPEGSSNPMLKSGARSWTVNGKACGPEFPNLTSAEQAAGMTFVTLLPTMYVVTHVDYVRTITVTPISPEVTELSATWLFSSETLDAPNFDLSNVVNFASTVLAEDVLACEINQRGLHSERYIAGTLMPQEFEVLRFQNWVMTQLGKQPRNE